MPKNIFEQWIVFAIKSTLEMQYNETILRPSKILVRVSK